MYCEGHWILNWWLGNDGSAESDMEGQVERGMKFIEVKVEDF